MVQVPAALTPLRKSALIPLSHMRCININRPPYTTLHHFPDFHTLPRYYRPRQLIIDNVETGISDILNGRLRCFLVTGCAGELGIASLVAKS